VTEFLKRSKAIITGLATGHVPLDIDVFTMDNSNTKKEGASYTYMGFNGFSPIAAYLGLEGWIMEIEMRHGSQHSQCDFIPYLLRVLHKALEILELMYLASRLIDSGRRLTMRFSRHSSLSYDAFDFAYNYLAYG
jgi:hypothetical protein